MRTKVKADVFFFDYAGGGGVLSGLEKLCTASSVLKGIPEGGSVAVKLHMGELGNTSYLRPVFVRRLVDLVKKRGGKPFITDTVALYPGGGTRSGSTCRQPPSMAMLKRASGRR